MIVTQNTKLNVVPGGILPVVHVSQYDVDRVLSFTLYDGNGAASIESGTTVTIEGTKPDGNGFQYAATITGNTVTVNTTIQMTVLSGTVDCKIVLRNGSQVIGTALFIMDVEKAGINENTPMSETDLPLIIAEATEQMERAEAAATAAALSEENAEAEALKAEGYATGKQNGEEVSSESPYYHNNAEYYSEYAESIAESLPDGLNIKGTCTFAELPSIADSFVGDTWVISDSFTTTSDFRGGSGVSVAASAYVYLTDSNKWDILPSKSGGHTILNESGTELPQRSKLQFEGAIVSDDETNDATVVETVNPVDYEEDIGSLQHQLTDQTNVLGAKNWLNNNEASQVINGITWTVNADKTVTANGTVTSGVLNSQFSIPFTFGGRSFLFNGSPNDNKCQSYIWDTTTSARAKKSNGDECDNSTNNSDSEVFPVEGHANKFVLRVVGTVSNVVFKPMLRLASDPDNTYVPHAMTNTELTEKKINLSDLKTVVSSSSDFAAFKTAIANL